MSERRQISDLSYMEQRSISPAFSINSLASEIMYCEDLFFDRMVPDDTTSERYYSSSWCSSPDSDISEMFTASGQNVDRVTRDVCQSFFDLGNVEESRGDSGKEAVRTTVKETALMLSVGSGDSETRGVPCASSTSTKTAIQMNQAHVKMSEHRQISDSSYMELKSISPASSMNSLDLFYDTVVPESTASDELYTWFMPDAGKSKKFTSSGQKVDEGIVKKLQSIGLIVTMQSPDETAETLEDTEPVEDPGFVKATETTQSGEAPELTESVLVMEVSESGTTSEATEHVKTPELTVPVETQKLIESITNTEVIESVETREATELVMPESIESFKTLEPTEPAKEPGASGYVNTPKAIKTVKILVATKSVQTLDMDEAIRIYQSQNVSDLRRETVSQENKKASSDTSITDTNRSPSITSERGSSQSTKQQSPKEVCHGEIRKSGWKSVFSGWRKKVHPATLKKTDVAPTSRSSGETSSSNNSSCAAVKPDHRFIPLVLVDYEEGSSDEEDNQSFINSAKGPSQPEPEPACSSHNKVDVGAKNSDSLMDITGNNFPKKDDSGEKTKASAGAKKPFAFWARLVSAIRSVLANKRYGSGPADADGPHPVLPYFNH